MSTFIFDFDGTLADSMPFYAAEMLSILERNNIDYPTDIIKIITPLGYQGAAKYYVEQFKLDYTVDALVELIHEELYPKYCKEIILKPEVADYLTALKEQGHSLNVLSASPYRVIAAVLKRCNVFDLFDNIWSCEEFHRTKGEVEIYSEAVERVGGALKDTFFFDDNLEAIKTAVCAGLYTIGVYDDASADYIEEIKNTANKFIYSFKEMR